MAQLFSLGVIRMRISIFILLASLAFGTGCAHSLYSVTIRTPAGQEIRDVKITSTAFSTEWSWVSHDKSITEYFYDRPVPSTALVGWSSLGGAHHEKTVQIADRLPSEFKPNKDGMIFDIDDQAEEVRLSFQIWYEQYRSREVQPR